MLDTELRWYMEVGWVKLRVFTLVPFNLALDSTSTIYLFCSGASRQLFVISISIHLRLSLVRLPCFTPFARRGRCCRPRVFHVLFSFVAVPPVIYVPNQLVGAPRGANLALECQVEASPKSINYWVKDSGKKWIASWRGIKYP